MRHLFHITDICRGAESLMAGFAAGIGIRTAFLGNNPKILRSA
jgi:hypothetical protein